MFVRVWSLSYRNGGVAASYFFDRGIIPLGLGSSDPCENGSRNGDSIPFSKRYQVLETAIWWIQAFFEKIFTSDIFPYEILSAILYFVGVICSMCLFVVIAIWITCNTAK